MDKIRCQTVWIFYRILILILASFGYSFAVPIGLAPVTNDNGDGLYFTEEPQDVIATRNRSAELNCSARVFATPGFKESLVGNITWRHNGETLMSNRRRYITETGSLYFTKVRHNASDRYRSDNGTYECVASSEAGTIVSRRALLLIAVLEPFSELPQNVTLRAGHAAWLRCGIRGIPKPVIAWQKNGKLLPQSDRFTQSSRGVLQITDVTELDTGQYRCRAVNAARERFSSPAQLTVVSPDPTGAPPRGRSSSLAPSLLVDPAQLEVVQGSSVILECSVINGPPGFLILWTRKDKRPLPAGRTERTGFGIMEIKDAKISDEGIYQCGLDNGGGSASVFAETSVTVLVPPSARIGSSGGSSSFVPVRFPTIVRLVCNFNGRPKPEVSWMKDNVKLRHNGRIKVLNETLMITQSTDSDSGMYQCWAENKAGRAGRIIRLFVQPSDLAPAAPSGVATRTESSRSIVVSWNASAPRKGLPIVAYSVHYLPTTGGTELQEVVVGLSIEVKMLQPYTNYTFYVVAYNNQTSSRHSKHVTQMTLEDVPLSFPLTRLFTVNSTAVRVQWTPLAAELARGKITQYRVFYRMQGTDERMASVSGTTTDLVLIGLEADQAYSVRVLAGTSAGFPSFSNDKWPWMNITLSNMEDSRVTDFTNVFLRLLNFSTCQLVWDRPLSIGSDLLGYKVKYFAQGHNSKPKIDVLLDDVNEHIIYGLFPDMVYVVSICPFTDYGESPIIEKTIRTLPYGVQENLVPFPPTNIHAEPVNETALLVTWMDTWSIRDRIQITQYTVFYHCDKTPDSSCCDEAQASGNISMSQINDGRASYSMCMSGLQPHSLYSISIQGRTRQTVGIISSPVKVRTLGDNAGQPLLVDCHPRSSTEVFLKWLPPTCSSDQQIAYIVAYSDDKTIQDGFWTTQTENGNSSFAVISGLRPRTTYYVKVQALTLRGKELYSDISEVTTVDDDYTPAPLIDMPLFNNEQVIGIIIGVSIAVACLILCMVILILRNRYCIRGVTRPNSINTPRLAQPPVADCNGRIYIPTNRPLLHNGIHSHEFTVPLNEHETTAMAPMLSDYQYKNAEHLDSKGGNQPIINDTTILNGYYGYINHNGYLASKAAPQLKQPQRTVHDSVNSDLSLGSTASENFLKQPSFSTDTSQATPQSDDASQLSATLTSSV